MLKDIDIRNALKEKSLAKFYRDDSLVLEELGIFWGDVRADLAVVNGHLHAYEIKSEADTLARFARQAKAYNSVFDYVTVVAHRRHLVRLDEMREQLGLETWGLMVADGEPGKVRIKTVRKARINRKVNPMSVCHLLWKADALELLRRQDIKGLSGCSKIDLYKLLCESFGKKILIQHVRQTLKRRRVDNGRFTAATA